MSKRSSSQKGKEVYFEECYKDKLLGVIFGQAVGDALGLGTEFMSRDKVVRNYPNRLTLYIPIIKDRRRRRWEQGEWTD